MSEILNPLLGTSRVLVEQVAWAAVTGGLFICVVWTACRTMPRLLSPGLKATLWWLACLKLVVGLVWIVPVPLPVLPAPAVSTVDRQSVGQRAPERPAPFLADSAAVTVAQYQNREVPTPKVDTVGALILSAAVVWFVGLALSLGMLLRRARQQASIFRMSKPLADEPTERAVATIAARLGLRSVPLVRMSDAIESPFVVGVARPTLLLPTALWTRLTDAEREIAICHECVHIQRRDLFMRWIPILAERLFFFLPLARLAAREYVLCNEATCDARVLRVLPATPRDYGNLLLAFGTSTSHAAVLAVGSSSFALLKRRLGMLAMPPRSSSVASRSLAVASVVVAILVLAPVRPVARPAEIAQRSVATEVTPVPQAGTRPQGAAADMAGADSAIVPVTPAAKVVVPTELPRVDVAPASPVQSQNASVPPQGEPADKDAAQRKELSDALLKAHMAAAKASEKVRAATTPEERERANSELAEAQKNVRALQDQYRPLAYPGMTHEEVVAMETGVARAMTMRREAPVIDPGAPTVTVLDFDKTVTAGKPMHFRVSVTGSVPVPTLMVALGRPPGTARTSGIGGVTASPTFGMNSSSKVADARTLTDFTINVSNLMTGDWVISIVATDAEGHTSEWVVGTVVVQPDPDAPTVAVLDFDKTVTAGEPMHFRVIVAGSVPVPTLRVALLPPVDVVRTSGITGVIASPTLGTNSSSKVADARTLTDFTIDVPKNMTGTCRIMIIAADAQGRRAEWVEGRVVVRPAAK